MGTRQLPWPAPVWPELILMDICMPNCNGLDAVRAIKKELPQIRIVMMSASDHDDDLYAAIKGGAEGYLLKNLEPPELFFYLDAVRRGERCLVAVSGGAHFWQKCKAGLRGHRTRRRSANTAPFRPNGDPLAEFEGVLGERDRPTG